MQAFKQWLPFAVVLTVVAAMVYGVSHQILRQSANDPQIQLAEDWADQITFGTEANRLSLGAFIDPAHSLAPFGIVYSQQGTILNASVAATGMAQPDGVFASTDRYSNGEARYTWQPSNGERYAVVLKKTTFQDQTFYVLAGRNLREVEKRSAQVLAVTVAGWFVGLVTVAAVQHLHVAHRVYRKMVDRIKK